MTEPTPADIRISGGAGPEEAAAIVAVISHLRSVEDDRRAEPPSRPHQSQWVLAGRPRTTSAPLPSHTYDPHGWSDAGDAES